ncbi:MAG TPA: DNA/RNA non-specific endonuclease, partial [Pyrinomonadaceae bacterium]|nr:DNA/RNA non-specific endonuclease [Pyrinomonadaceae bacterium]
VKGIKSLTRKSIPVTKVGWDTKNIDGSTVGKKMTASILSINPGTYAGSAPHQTNPLWHAVNQRTNAYVQGHLLNHHLHGKGENENMVPIARTTNSTMSARVEEKVKEAIFEKRESVYYEVNMIFGNQPSRRIPQEEKLPTRIDFVAYTLKADKTKKKDLSVPPSLPHDLPANDPLNRPREVINLNKLPTNEKKAVAKLDTIPQIGQKIAEKIVAAVKEIRKNGPVHRYSQLSAEDSSIPSNVLEQLEKDGWVTLYPH